MTKQNNLRAGLIAALIAAALSGCGGGGGGGGESAAPGALVDAGSTAPVTSEPVTGVQNDVAVACSGCSALDATTYSGSGIGVWEHTNTTGADKDVAISLSGITGQDVNLVFTNETAAPVAFPATVIQPSASNLLGRQLMSTSLPGDTDLTTRIAEFNRNGWFEGIQSARQQSPSRNILSGSRRTAAQYTIGSTRDFWHDENDVRSTTLRQQATTADGTTVNVWVETAEYDPGKVSDAIVGQLSDVFARANGVYDMLKRVGGPLWGPHDYPAELISGTGQPIDIVVLNFDKNTQPYGTVGYFWGLHALAKSVDARSNESVSLYLDSETMYLDGAFGLKTAKMTLAHEGMHMSNFYRRGVKMSPEHQFDLWLEEMTALMMEDAASAAVDPSFNPIRDVRLPDYLGFGSGNCALMAWLSVGGKCDGYAISGSVGGFLLRHFGTGFFTQLLNASGTDSEVALKAALVDQGTSLGQQLRRFAVTTSGLLPPTAPPGYGYPGRQEDGFTIPGIDLAGYVQATPLASPATLAAYGNFMVQRADVNGTFSATVRVPVGSTLSVLVR